MSPRPDTIGDDVKVPSEEAVSSILKEPKPDIPPLPFDTILSDLSMAMLTCPNTSSGSAPEPNSTMQLEKSLAATLQPKRKRSSFTKIVPLKSHPNIRKGSLIHQGSLVPIQSSGDIEHQINDVQRTSKICQKTENEQKLRGDRKLKAVQKTTDGQEPKDYQNVKGIQKIKGETSLNHYQDIQSSLKQKPLSASSPIRKISQRTRRRSTEPRRVPELSSVDKWHVLVEGNLPTLVGICPVTHTITRGIILERLEQSLILLHGQKKVVLGAPDTESMAMSLGWPIARSFSNGFPPDWNKLLLPPVQDPRPPINPNRTPKKVSSGSKASSKSTAKKPQAKSQKRRSRTEPKQSAKGSLTSDMPREISLDDAEFVRKSRSGRRCVQPLKFWLTERILPETGTLCTIQPRSPESESIDRDTPSAKRRRNTSNRCRSQ